MNTRTTQPTFVAVATFLAAAFLAALLLLPLRSRPAVAGRDSARWVYARAAAEPSPASRGTPS